MKPRLRDSVPRTSSVPLGPGLAISFPSFAAWTPKEEIWSHVEPEATPLEERERMGEEKNGTWLWRMCISPTTNQLGG